MIDLLGTLISLILPPLYPFYQKVTGTLVNQGKRAWVRGICGLVVAVIAGIAKFSVMNLLFDKYAFFSMICAYLGIPLPGAGLSILGFVCLFPFTGAILGLFAGEFLGAKAMRILTRKPVEGILVDVVGGIICGLIAAFLFSPLGSE